MSYLGKGISGFVSGLSRGINARRTLASYEQPQPQVQQPQYPQMSERSAMARTIHNDPGNPGVPVYLRDMIDRHEGGSDYGMLFARAQRDPNSPFSGKDITGMTLNELYTFTDPSGAYGQWVKNRLAQSGKRARVATPLGRYQIVGSTLRQAAADMGLDPNTRFTPDVQDRIFEHLAWRRIRNAKSQRDAINAVRAEWEGLRSVSDRDLGRAIDEFHHQYMARHFRPVANPFKVPPIPPDRGGPF